MVLTKPLGTQVAVNLHQWMDIEEKWALVRTAVVKDDAEKAYQRAMASMAKLNKTGTSYIRRLFIDVCLFIS